MPFIEVRKGADLSIEEMPQGAFLTQEGKTIRISSLDDAYMIIESLERMIEAFTEQESE